MPQRFLLGVVCLLSCLAPPQSVAQPTGPRPQQVDKAMLGRGEVIGHLRARRFDRLEFLLEEARKAALADPAREPDFENAIRAFRIADLDARAQLDAWVAAKPRSWAARLARGRYLDRQAFLARGSALAYETTARQFAEMEELQKLASRDVAAALQVEPQLTEAYAILIDQARSGKGGLEACRKLGEKALAFAPGSLRIWERLLSCAEPRWGGSRQQIEATIADSQKDSGRNRRLLALRGWVAADQAWSAGIAASRAYEEKDEEGKKKAIELGIRYWSQALSFGDHWSYYDGRAATHRQLGRWKEACADISAALALLPDDPELLLDRSSCNHGLLRLEAAKADLVQARGLDPGVPGLADQRKKLRSWLDKSAAKHYQQGRFGEAIALYELWAEVEPESARPHYDRGRALWKQGDLAAAKVALDRALELQPDHFDTVRNIDHLLASQRKWQEILPYWERFLARQPDHAGALFERSGTYHHLGNAAAALRDLGRSCELGNQEACAQKKRLGG